jgi:hypothetical protein
LQPLGGRSRLRVDNGNNRQCEQFPIHIAIALIVFWRCFVSLAGPWSPAAKLLCKYCLGNHISIEYGNNTQRVLILDMVRRMRQSGDHHMAQ